MKHIWFKLTVKYMRIYTVLQDSKGKKAICNIPLSLISDHCNKLSMTFPFEKKKNILKLQVKNLSKY